MKEFIEIVAKDLRMTIDKDTIAHVCLDYNNFSSDCCVVVKTHDGAIHIFRYLAGDEVKSVYEKIKEQLIKV